jgi:hypothetical protein
MIIKQLLQDLSYKKDKKISRHAKGLLLAMEKDAKTLDLEIIDNEKNEKELSRAKDCAKGCYDYIKEIFERYDKAREEENEKESENIETELDESDYGQSIDKTFSIILAGGGPAVRIHGDLDDDNSPYNVRLQYQDWFTSWEDYKDVDSSILERFAERHYFGE